MFGNFEPADLAFLSHTYSDHYPQPYEEVKETSVLQVIGWYPILCIRLQI